MPESASTFSWKVDALYFYLSGVTLFFTLLISAVLIFLSFVTAAARRMRFRARRRLTQARNALDGDSLRHRDDDVWLGCERLFRPVQATRECDRGLRVGKQWMWKLQHATGQREINELHVPVGRKVKLIMTTEDVIHDFFVPAFRTKADVIPGSTRRSGLKRRRPGTMTCSARSIAG